jgi:fucose permease
MNVLQAMMVTALLVSGMVAALLGSIKVPLAKRLQIDEARVGGLVSIFGFILIPVIFVAGFLTDHLGKQVVMVAGSVLLAASLALLARATTYRTALIAVLLLGGAWSLMINVGNVLTLAAFGGGSPGNEAFAFNLANVFFGLGAFLTPMATALLVRRTSLGAALGVLGVLALLPAGLTLAVEYSVLAPPAEAESFAAILRESANLLGDPILWLCGFALFFYGPLEASLGAWTTTYLGDQGLSDRAASGFLSAFWLTFMAARLLTALCLPRGMEATLVLLLSLACVGVLGGLVYSPNRHVAAAMVLSAGLIFGPIFPTLMAILLGHFPKPVHGRAVGMFFAIGGIGWTMIPLLIGAYARRTSVQRGFSVAVAAAVALSGVALLLLRNS